MKRTTTQPTKHAPEKDHAALLAKHGVGGFIAPPHVPEKVERTQDVLYGRHTEFHGKVGRLVADCDWCPQIATQEVAA